MQTSPPPITNIQTLWDNVIYQFDQGNLDTSAMQTVWTACPPQITYQDVTTVFSAVYANSYWDINGASQTKLANALVAGLGVGQSSADQYAANALAQWRGMFVRKNTQDTGVIPFPGTNYTQSVDIVVNNATALTPSILVTNWNNMYFENPQVGKNYCYCRCQNLAFMGDIDPTVQMFYSEAGFSAPPSSWVKMPLMGTAGSYDGTVLDVNGNVLKKMGNGVRGVSEAFNFQTTSTAHVCIIGIVKSKFFDNNATQGPFTNWSSATWLTHNGAAGWHNQNPQTAAEQSLKFYNYDSTPQTFVFTAQCSKVPVGSKIRLSHDSGIKDGDFATPSLGTTHKSQLISIEATVPAYYEGYLTVSIEGPNGEHLSSDAAIQLTQHWKLTPGHEHYMNAVYRYDGYENAQVGTPVYVQVGDYRITGS